MGKLMFYEVSKQYIDYLKLFEPKIPNINYGTNNKFVCGIVLSVASREKEIKNRIGYLKVCIYNSIHEIDVDSEY